MFSEDERYSAPRPAREARPRIPPAILSPPPPEARVARALRRSKAGQLTDLFGAQAGAAAARRIGLAIDEADLSEAMLWLGVQGTIEPVSY